MLKKIKLKRGILKRVALIKKASFLNKHFQTTFSCSLKIRHINDDLEYAKKIADFKSKPKKKKIGSTLLLIANFLIIAGIFVYFFVTYKVDNLSEFFYRKINWWFLVLAVVMLLASIGLETLRYSQLIYKSTGKFRPFLALKTHILGKYYDNITPFAAGGQPFQIFYLNKHGIKGEIATSIPLVKQMIQLTAFTFMSILVLISNIFIPITYNPIIITIAIVSCVINGALVAVILLFSISKRVGPGIVIKILKFLNKIKIVKNYRVTFFKVSRFVKNYQKSVKIVAKSWRTLLLQFVLAIVTFIVFYAVVYCIYRAFVSVNLISLLDIVCCMNLCDLCASIVPLPGGSGAAEISFDAIFGKLFSSNPGALPFAMLIWKVLTYFLFILFGGVLIFAGFIISKIRGKRIETPTSTK